jgi:hypothetical protein
VNQPTKNADQVLKNAWKQIWRKYFDWEEEQEEL